MLKNKPRRNRLRIYYAAMESANNLAMPWSKVWHNNLYLTLKKNHDVTLPCFDILRHYNTTTGQCKAEVNPSQAKAYYSSLLFNDIKNKHKKKKIDLFFSYYDSRNILPETVEQIKQLGIKTVNFYCNSLTHFHLIKEIAPHYDYSMFVEKEAEKKYRAIGANPIYIQEAANPDIYKSYRLKKEYDVTFVGQNYLNRSEYIKYLYEQGIKVRVWGHRWIPKYKKTNPKHYLKKLKDTFIRRYKSFDLPKSITRPPLSDLEMVKMFSRSKISLGFSEVIVQNKEEKNAIKRHIRLRDFEAPMSGAFYMTGHQKELEQYFRVGKEIVCYDTKEELLEKVKYYLEHEEEREKIRLAGYKRALRDHTWERRFDELFTKIGLLR